MTNKIKCVMCGSEAEYLAEAKYRDGTKQEPLCEKYWRINEAIKRSK